MAVKSWMHPRNIYRNPPNFKELAIAFPEFRKYVQQKLDGRVTINYEDAKAVAELTRSLLLRDFSLNVEIIETRLIPRVPLCLNYLLWIEDLLTALDIKDRKPLGIDIGTGPICIYPLLAAKTGWKMLATEVDEDNAEMAKKNVTKNHLENDITVKLVSNSDKLLNDVIDNDITYDFCMCNPPFFDHGEKPKNRSDRRPQVISVASENLVEVATSGGELAFVKKIISESDLLKDRIKIYTSLLGKKSDFLLLRDDIKKLSTKTFASTEFCQGRTTRWGIAWSYLDINLKEAGHHELQKGKKQKNKNILKHVVSKNEQNTSLEEIIQKVTMFLNLLKLYYAEEEFDKEGFCYKVKAYENTWSHQRRKKREGKNSQDETADVTKEKAEVEAGSSTNECGKRLLQTCINEYSDLKKLKVSHNAVLPSKTVKNVLVEFLFIVREDETSVIMELPYLSGNKESIHQILQYMKNNWNKTAQDS